MERPRFVHFARLGSARTIYPRSSPASPGSPCDAFSVAMAPLASSEPDIPGAGLKVSAPSVTSTSTSSPSPSPSTVTLLREPSRRGSSSSSYTSLDRQGHAAPVTEASTLPRYAEYRYNRHDRSASLADGPAQRSTQYSSYSSSSSSQRSLPFPGEASTRQMNASKNVGVNTHNRSSNPTSPQQTSSGIPVNKDQRLQRPMKTIDSGIPRAAGIRSAVCKQATNDSSENSTRSESQSSPQQIRRVLRSSPAFAQFHSKTNPAADNVRAFSKLVKPTSFQTKSNHNNKGTQPSLGSHDVLRNHCHHVHTRSDTSLVNGNGIHTHTPMPVSKGLTQIPSHNAQTQGGNSTTASSTNSLKSIRQQISPHKNRPTLLNLGNGIKRTPESVASPTSQAASRIPMPGTSVPDASPASTPNGIYHSRSKSGPAQTPTRPRQPYQRQALSSKNASQPGQEAKEQRASRSVNSKISPPGRSKCVREENIQSITNGNTTSNTNAHFKSSPRGNTHKQGFGFGYACTANASIKRKSKCPNTLPRAQDKPPANGSHNKAVTSETCRNGNVSTAKDKPSQSSQKSRDDTGAFQGSWKRNSMRLATQGYSSMSDLTKSIDCLVLDTDSQNETEHACDLEEDFVIKTISDIPLNGVISREVSEDKRRDRTQQYNLSDESNHKTSINLKDYTLSANPSTYNSCTRIPNSSAFSQNPETSSANCANTKKASPQNQSRGIPIKQSYFANTSFILVPGVADVPTYYDPQTRSTDYSSPSGSPSSGYSSSPASRERHPVHKNYDNYYEQQEHQNKIKRRSFLLATSSISDLSYYLDDTNASLVRNNDLVGSEGESTNLSSISSVSEEFHTPELHRRQPSSLTGPDSGHLNSSFGSFYSCQSQVNPSPKFSPPTKSKKEEKRKSFYDNCQDSPKQNDRRQPNNDGYESEESTTDSEYKTASTSSFLGKTDLNWTDRDDRIRAKLLSRHWVRSTPYRHSRYTPEQALDQQRHQAYPSHYSNNALHSRTDQRYAQYSPKQNRCDLIPDENRKNKESPKSSKKSPSPPESRKIPKKRVTSPIAWCTSRAAVETKSGKSQLAKQRQRSNSSPFPSGSTSPRKSRDIPESTTAPALNAAENQINSHIDQYQMQSSYASNNHYSNGSCRVSASVDGDLDEFFDTDTDERWMEPPRAPPSLGRPRRKEYAGFDSQPLPIDSFVSDSSSVYTDNTSSCSSRAPSRSADVESYSRRSSIASSTRDFPPCSRAFSSGASGTLTPRRQMSDDTICNDLSYQGQLGESQHLGNECFLDTEGITTVNRVSTCEDDVADSQTDRPRSQSFSSSRCSASESSSRDSFETSYSRTQLKGSVSSQCQPHQKDFAGEVETLTKARSCSTSRRTSDVSSRKSSTSGISSGSCSEEYHHQTVVEQQQQQQHKPLKDAQTRNTGTFPSKRKYFSSRDILDLLITPEKGEGGGSTSLTSLEKQAQKVCRAILCCNEMNRSMPPREFQF